jgi:hypothetical protein
VTKEQVSVYNKAYSIAHKEELKIYHRTWLTNRRRARREATATRPRPMTCEVCGAAPSGRTLHWDHDHKSGAFRGWLCHHCNGVLGWAKDSPVTLRALAAYLEAGGPA